MSQRKPCPRCGCREFSVQHLERKRDAQGRRVTVPYQVCLDCEVIVDYLGPVIQKAA